MRDHSAMFTRHEDHALLKHGAQAKGVLTNVGEHRSASHNIHFDVRGHVKLPGGQQVDFQAENLDSHKLGWFKVGQVVPVRYDTEDHSKVLLDVPALEQQHAADRAAAKDVLAHQTDDAAVARADAKLARGGAVGDEDDWPEDGIK